MGTLLELSALQKKSSSQPPELLLCSVMAFANHMHVRKSPQTALFTSSARVFQLPPISSLLPGKIVALAL